MQRGLSIHAGRSHRLVEPGRCGRQPQVAYLPSTHRPAHLLHTRSGHVVASCLARKPAPLGRTRHAHRAAACGQHRSHEPRRSRGRRDSLCPWGQLPKERANTSLSWKAVWSSAQMLRSAFASPATPAPTVGSFRPSKRSFQLVLSATRTQSRSTIACGPNRVQSTSPACWRRGCR